MLLRSKDYKENSGIVNARKVQSQLFEENYFNCEQMPLFDGPDDTILLAILVPGKLHLRLGFVNDAFDILDAILNTKNCSIVAKDWSDSISMTKGFQYGAKLMFNGRQCKKLIDNIDKLKELLSKAGALDLCMPVVKCLESYKIVEDKCFGMNLDPCYKYYITAFGESYRNLCKYIRSGMNYYFL